MINPRSYSLLSQKQSFPCSELSRCSRVGVALGAVGTISFACAFAFHQQIEEKMKPVVFGIAAVVALVGVVCAIVPCFLQEHHHTSHNPVREPLMGEKEMM